METKESLSVQKSPMTADISYIFLYFVPHSHPKQKGVTDSPHLAHPQNQVLGQTQNMPQ